MARAHYDSLLRGLDASVLRLGSMVIAAINASMHTLEESDVHAATIVIAADNQVDALRRSIERDAITLIATQQPAAGDLRTIVGALTVSNELERMGDYCEGIARLALRMVGEPVLDPVPEIGAMATATTELARQAIDSYGERDVDKAASVWSSDDEIDALYLSIFRDLIAEMVETPDSVRRGTYMLWVAHNLERIADRAANIAENTAFVVTGDIAEFRQRALSQALPR